MADENSIKPEDNGEDRGDGRDVGGRFAKGNTSALVHGNRSARVRAGLLPEQSILREWMREKEAAIIADQGGVDVISAIRADMVRSYVALSTQARWCEDNLAALGFMTAKGRPRAVLSAYLGVVDRMLRVAGAIGLDRKQKPVGSLEDWMKNHGGASSAASSTREVSQAGGDADRPASGNVAFDRTKSSPDADEAAQ